MNQRMWCLLVALLCGALAAPARAQSADELPDIGAGGDGAVGVVSEESPVATAAAAARSFFELRAQSSWVPELCVLAFMGAFLINIYIGRARNERLALAWTSELVASDGVLDRNFTLLGPGDTEAGEVLLKDSMHCFKFWASGRRFCQGLMATFRLVRRQDLLAYSVMALRGQKDVLELEVRMTEGAMPPLVLVVAPSLTARNMLSDSPDVTALAKRVEPTRDRVGHWPDRLWVLAEHSSIFYDLMTPQILELAFGKEAFNSIRPYFRFLHITSECPEGDHKQVVRLSFALPPAGDTATLDKFLVLTMLLVDLLGSYKPSPEQLKRAAEARQKREAVARAGEADERQRRVEERRQQKAQEEADRLKRLPPEQRARELERKQKLQMKRQMSKYSKKM